MSSASQMSRIVLAPVFLLCPYNIEEIVEEDNPAIEASLLTDKPLSLHKNKILFEIASSSFKTTPTFNNYPQYRVT